MEVDLPDIIRLSDAIIDRHARLIIEWDKEVKGRIWIDNGSGTTKYFYDGEDARLVWNFYHPERVEGWKGGE